MDPIKVYSPIEYETGYSLWIPFDCFNIQEDGSCDRRPAYDLPSFATKEDALNYLSNHPGLTYRPLHWVEFKKEELKKHPQLASFVHRNLMERYKIPGL